MSRIVMILICWTTLSPLSWAQDVVPQKKAVLPEGDAEIRKRLTDYVETFNKHDANAVGSFWTLDAVSLAEDSGERLTGRDSLVVNFAEFFKQNPSAKLTGEITELRFVRPDVATMDGTTTLLVDGSEPVISSFSAVVVKDGNEWLISSSRERDVPIASSETGNTLSQFEWLIGTWKDQSEDAEVITKFSWSRNQAFLIRSFTVQYAEGELLEGTQVIGWDPLNRQIRTWTFSSDGSFGQGTVSQHDNDWLLKMWQVASDGQIGSATQVISRVDADTITVEVIGETLNGEPVPSAAPVTVKRVAEAKQESAEEKTENAGAKQ